MKQYMLQCTYVLQPHNHEHGGLSQALLLLPSVFFALYGLGVFILRQRNKRWNGWRTMCFVAGCLLVGFSLSPVMIDYAHHRFSGHVLQHLLLGMLAPVALVLGAPALLALQVLPKNGARRLSGILGSRPFHFISHPVTALVLTTGGMYALYLTPLYNSLHNHGALQILVHVHFLAAGYVFTWAMIGPDPAPRRPTLQTRLTVLFVSIAAHAYLSKFMYAYGYPRNTVHSEAEIRAAARLMYYGGDMIELVLVVVLFTYWYRKKGKPYYRLPASG